MALIATCTTPYEAEPAGGVSVPIAQAFPVEPMAWGNLEVPDSWSFDKFLNTNAHRTNVLHPPASHLERTKGQIWPR